MATNVDVLSNTNTEKIWKAYKKRTQITLQLLEKIYNNLKKLIKTYKKQSVIRPKRMGNFETKSSSKSLQDLAIDFSYTLFVTCAETVCRVSKKLIFSFLSITLQFCKFSQKFQALSRSIDHALHACHFQKNKFAMIVVNKV